MGAYEGQEAMWKGLALHTWTLDSTPLAEVLRVARATGWDAVELRRLDFRRAAEAGRSAEHVLDFVRASGLAVACVGVERRRLLDAFAESCRWARALQSETVMSAVDAGESERAQAVASVAEAADIAAAHGVKLALEFISQAEQFNMLVQSASAKAWIAKAKRLVPYANEVNILVNAGARVVGEIRSLAKERR